MAKAESKAAKKIAEKKAKIAAKCGKAAKCAALLFALGEICAGCATSDPSSRSTSAKYGDITVRLENAASNVVSITIGDGAIASADSAGSTETMTATPTNTTDIKPQTDVNTTGGRTAGVLESIVGAFGTWLTTPSGKKAAANANSACTTGNCSPGASCPDGNCSECTDCQLK